MFETKGAVPESQLVYRLLEDKDFGAVITYEQLDGVLSRNFRSSRSPLYTAQRMLERNRSRTLAPVRNTGYRVVEAREHEGLGRGHHKKARRQLTKAGNRLHSADRSALTEDERRRIDGLELAVTRQAQMIRRLDERATQHDADLLDLRRQTDAARSEAKDAASKAALVQDLLKRHGIS